MISGSVNANNEAVINLLVRGSTGQKQNVDIHDFAAQPGFVYGSGFRRNCYYSAALKLAAL